jgi:hypothetical protein
MLLPHEEVYRVTFTRISISMLKFYLYFETVPRVELTGFARYGARSAPNSIIEVARI